VDVKIKNDLYQDQLQYQDQWQKATGGDAEATGGQSTINQQDLIRFNPVFNFGNPAQKAVDVTMNAYDQYQQALLDKYYADTLRDIAMAALGGGGAGGGGDVVGPVGYSNLVTGALTRYQQPKPVVKKERHRREPKQPKNPTPSPGPVPPPLPRPPFGLTTMDSASAAEGETGGFEPGQFLADVQADAGGDEAGRIMPPIPPRPPQEDWDERDTEEFVEKGNEAPGWGSGPMVDPGIQPRKLTLPNPMALASLQQRPPEVPELQNPTYNAANQGRPPRPGQPQQQAADDPYAAVMKQAMSGAGVPLGGQLAAQVNKQGEANEFQNLVTANRRGLDLARTAQGFKGQERGLRESQQAFAAQKAQDVMGDLISKGPLAARRLGPGTSVRVQA